MSRIHPVVFVWTDVDVVDADGEVRRGKAMVPLARYANICGRQFELGEEYPLAVVEDRSKASHNAYFAQVNEYFDQLPEKVQARWPSAEHLRKWALCETGWFDEKEFDCETETQAKRLSTFIRTEDEYARIFRRGMKVIVRRAKSQSMADMKKQAFEDSKRAVLDLLESFTGIPVSTMKKEAGRHA